jgi:hypothetical protein
MYSGHPGSPHYRGSSVSSKLARRAIKRTQKEGPNYERQNNNLDEEAPENVCANQRGGQCVALWPAYLCVHPVVSRFAQFQAESARRGLASSVMKLALHSTSKYWV